jgi:hypothetical protein
MEKTEAHERIYSATLGHGVYASHDSLLFIWVKNFEGKED